MDLLQTMIIFLLYRDITSPLKVLLCRDITLNILLSATVLSSLVNYSDKPKDLNI